LNIKVLQKEEHLQPQHVHIHTNGFPKQYSIHNAEQGTKTIHKDPPPLADRYTLTQPYILNHFHSMIGPLTNISGCFTCRLRRKKCDEGKPQCRACKHLGLACEYKRPVWWGNVDARKRQKEHIKILIKRTKLTEKAAHLTSPPGSIDSPPDLTHSLPTSDTFSEPLGRHRSVSIESGYSLYDDQTEMHHGMHPLHYQHQYHHSHFPGVPSPYEYDGFVEQKQTYVNGFPVSRRPSSTASYASSNLRRSSIVVDQPFMHHPSIPESVASDETNSYFDFNQYQPPPTPSYIPVEGGDRQLLDHFLQDVQRLIFPILNLHGTARQDVILPALLSNACYRHCCLSIAALHMKTTQHLTGVHAEYVDQDITRHRYKTISGLCEALAKDTDHLQILEATLGMILFQVITSLSISSF
jgi:hypothetical protein